MNASFSEFLVDGTIRDRQARAARHRLATVALACQACASRVRQHRPRLLPAWLVPGIHPDPNKPPETGAKPCHVPSSVI
jgi:hypothetical protein